MKEILKKFEDILCFDIEYICVCKICGLCFFLCEKFSDFKKKV